MELILNQEDVDMLGGSWSNSFAQAQADRFEKHTYKGVPFEEVEDGKLFIHCDAYLNALITYNWYTGKGYRSAILYDTSDDWEHVVWVNMTLEEWSEVE